MHGERRVAAFGIAVIASAPKPLSSREHHPC